MNITIGNPVRYDSFFDRETLIEELWSILETDNVLLAAPRRVGKTSIMHRLLDYPAAGFRVLFLDGQYYSSAEDLVTDLIVEAGKLIGDAPGLIRKAFTKIQENIGEIEIWKLKIQLRKEVAGQWREEGERAVHEACGKEGKLLLILDEFPKMLHKMIQKDQEAGKSEAIDLLDWLRRLRMDPDLNLRLRQIIGGSIGLPRIASYVGATHTINDLRSVEIGPFDRETARLLATELLASRNAKIDAETMEAFLNQVGTYLPINIQIMSSIVASTAAAGRTPLTPESIVECYEERALAPEFRTVFEDYYERLDRYYASGEAYAARRILRELAVPDGPVAKSALLAAYQEEIGPDARASDFDLLLNWLEDDFYLEETEGGKQLTFKNKWLKDWWRRYHASGD